MFVLVTALAILLLAAIAFLRLPQFGRIPSGARLTRIRQSPNYKNDQFQNLHPTPELTEGAGYYRIMKEFLTQKSDRSEPPSKLPSRKTNLLTFDPTRNVLVWFGHSSYFIQVDGKKILVDPVFSGAASPIKFTTPSYPGSDIYSTDDIPSLDLLILTHDHWDHLDYETLLKLRPKASKVLTSLGVGAHLERWNFNAEIVTELDWNDSVSLDSGWTLTCTPARHFSGRGFKRKRTIWSSFVLNTPHFSIYIGGDSGYDTHFKEIGEKYGPFDWAMLECGQYNKNWRYIHMLPPEVVQAGLDLRARHVIPVHWSKFSLSLHAWDDPIEEVTRANAGGKLPMVTPMIGEAVDLTNPAPSTPWWREVVK